MLGRVHPDLLPDIFTRRQAVEAGVSDVRLRTWVRRGLVRRLRHGTYERAEPVAPEARSARHVSEARVALDRFTTGYAASHLTAAAAYGLPLPMGPAGPVHLTTIHSTQRSRTPHGAVLHHCDSVEPELDLADGLVVTSTAWTVADCLRSFGPRVSVPIADAALHRGLTAPQDVRAVLESQRRWRGKPRARASLMLVDGRRESWLESWGSVRFHEWGVNLPEPQVVIEDLGGLFLGRVDGGWKDDATVLELDGRAKYQDDDGEGIGSTFWREKSRHNDLTNVGLTVVRFELRDLLERPRSVQHAVWSARRAGDASRFTGLWRSTPSTGLTFL
ncbi:type IV toxin-antitoxin system AbiEi family antitoxin domain-containing protein [Pedococcus sp. 5OH_020]|uniref:type IV toxin-antitoxin system AbiEi family antitoxin domain-containing protein n=1 Tax=Pedococcus sp. 5OH_020 TaxID=2989814 RepID=UPI0022E9A930|nr:type IV toxin-antitoxin system AbiEi family antitoxin domain-containing protein [Pedococcus sp. 5OH_020]